MLLIDCSPFRQQAQLVIAMATKVCGGSEGAVRGGGVCLLNV